MQNRTKRRFWMNVGYAVVIVLLLGILCWLFVRQEQPPRKIQNPSQSGYAGVEYGAAKYRYNTDLTNILFLGIDKEQDITHLHLPSQSGQCDFLALLSLNQRTKEARILQINRNTVTELDFYDMFGNYSKSLDGQIALQYAYHIGGSGSCWAVKKTVREMLLDIPIEAVLAMDISGVPVINDLLGGITVTMKRDYTHIDSAFVGGAQVRLTGAQAERFVRYRDITQFNSVEDRMSRQMDYLLGLMEVAGTYPGSQLFALMEPYWQTLIVTDMTEELAKSLPSYRYLTEDILSLPGQERMGETYEEFILDEEALREMVFAVFYVPE